MPVSYPYTQYSGIWTMQQVNAAVAAGTWPVAYNSGGLYAWGINSAGQLGLNNLTSYSSPKQVGSQPSWKASAIAAGFGVAVKNDGTLWTWGTNPYGNGLGNTTYYSSPKQVGALTTWNKVTAGRYAAFIIKTDGTLWVWGRGNGGQLGLGNTTSYSSPVQVGTLTNWLQISSTYIWDQVSAVKTDGTLWTWGDNTLGGLGLGNTTNYSSPKQVGGLNNWLQVTTLYQAAIAVKTDGTIWSWGKYGATAQSADYSSPKQIGLLTNWATVSGGSYYGLATATKTDGTLWAWGNGIYGGLGLGNTASYISPKQVGALTNWARTSSFGNNFTISVKTDGTLWSWGQNNNGQLGLGDRTNRSSPVQVGSSTGWLASSIGTAPSLSIAII